MGLSACRNRRNVSEYLKNTAEQHIGFTAVNSLNGGPKTTGVNITICRDGITQQAGIGILTHKGNGHFDYQFTAEETDGDHIYIGWHGTDTVPGGINIYTTSVRNNSLKILLDSMDNLIRLIRNQQAFKGR
jgi:hypothetical protein